MRRLHRLGVMHNFPELSDPFYYLRPYWHNNYYDWEGMRWYGRLPLGG